LSLFGIKLVRLSKLKQLQKAASYNYNISDIEGDKQFMKIYYEIKDYTLVSIERSYTLYKAVQYIVENKIPGDFVECGVWRGGSCMLIAYTLMIANVVDRKIWLYDTFSGMVKPGENDGDQEKELWEKYRVTDDTSTWCLGEFEDVQKNLFKTGFPQENFKFIKGKVEKMIPSAIPQSISLLRLDTDWYESTKHELEFLFPILVNKGILLIDDYGAWQGSRIATDEYFSKKRGVFLNRIDYAGRLVIK
jgi:O-methyltransferase